MKKQKEKKSSGTGFLIQKIHYEYNDEYYYRLEEDSGIPIKFFLNEEAALNCFNEEIIKHVSNWSYDNLNTFEGCYETLDEVLRNLYEEIKQTSPKRVATFPDSDTFIQSMQGWSPSTTLTFFTNEEIIYLLDELKIKLFYIQEVDIYE